MENLKMINGFLIAIPSLDPIYNILGRSDYFILLLILLVILMVALLTERVEKVRTLNKLNEELKREATKLEDANNELEAFAYSVSHDLRVPLRAIDGFSRIVIEDYETELDVEGVRLLNIIRENTKKMGQLIDDILLLSRAGRQEMNLGKLDISALAKNVYQEFEQETKTRNINFVVQDMPAVEADRALMTQVLTNLIGNAIKFTKKTENPKIEFCYTEDEDNYIYQIKDNGAGFNMKYYDKLFGLFQRLHSQEEFEGTGVGLSIVQRIISRHNGRVWGEGEVGKGATIYFSLPKK